MPYRLKQDEKVEESIRRIAGEQVDRAIASADEAIERDGDADEAVHEVRRRMKKVRAVVRLVRPEMPEAYREANEFFRDTARLLSGIRDRAAGVETLDDLSARSEDPIVGASISKARAALLEEGGGACRDRAVELLREARGRLIEKAHDLIAGFGLGQGCFDSLQGGLKKAYRRARKRMREALAEPETARFHEWRKRAKYHRYHVRLLRRAFYPLLDRRREQIHLLTDHLGDEHDLAVLGETLDELVRSIPTDEEDALEPCRKLIERRRTELRALAGPLGQKLFAEKPKHFVRRVEAYWEVWREDPPVLPEPIETLL